jgi:hypothetical protein
MPMSAAETWTLPRTATGRRPRWRPRAENLTENGTLSRVGRPGQDCSQAGLRKPWPDGGGHIASGLTVPSRLITSVKPTAPGVAGRKLWY